MAVPGLADAENLVGLYGEAPLRMGLDIGYSGRHVGAGSLRAGAVITALPAVAGLEEAGGTANTFPAVAGLENAVGAGYMVIFRRVAAGIDQLQFGAAFQHRLRILHELVFLRQGDEVHSRGKRAGTVGFHRHHDAVRNGMKLLQQSLVHK